MKFKILLIISLLSIYSVIYGQYNTGDSISRKKITAIKITETLKIDGILDEGAWKNAPTASGFVERNPNNGNPEPASYASTVKILYDNSGVYFGAEFKDPIPENIKKELTERDDIGNDDVFGITINGYNDRQQGMMFMVQASGVQADAKIFSNANDDFSWNAVWFSAVKIHETGWTAEVKIPYSELRFPKNDVQIWGINFIRMIKHSNQQFTWNFVNNKKATYMLYDGVLNGISDVKTPTRLSFMPYFSTYLNNYDGKTTASINGGMDLKYGINDAFTLDLTLIPDFGQANFDQAVLNLGPFEQQYQENRSFFTEGTELFNKGNLFYSRRVGGRPSKYPNLSPDEEVLEYPDKVKLFNAVKVSGRTNKGLGIGFFNGVTEKMEATVKDKISGNIRKEVVEPWANYNVLVLDQRFGGNSSVSFVNTNVTREGYFRDANVSAMLFDVANKKNTYNVFGSVKESIVNDSEMNYGTEATLGANKNSGKNRFGGNVNFRTKNYNIDDLGFTGGNNFINYYGYYNYRYLKPKGNLNILNYRVNVDLTNRIDTHLFSNFSIHQNIEFQNKKFQNFGMGLYVEPFGQKDIYEPREFGRHLNVPMMVNPWIFYNSDSRKRLSYGGFTEIYVYDESARIRYVSEWNTRYRFSDKFWIGHEFNYDISKNDVGFAGRENSDIIMGKRNRNTFVNGINSQYTFNDKMTLSMAFRHYFSSVDYDKFYILNTEGNLIERNFEDNRDGTYNYWNIDLRYSWWFAPGSQLTLLYRNAVDSYLDQANPKLNNNFDYLFSKPQLNNLSLKVTYYLDYNRAKNWLNKKPVQDF